VFWVKVGLGWIVQLGNNNKLGFKAVLQFIQEQWIFSGLHYCYSFLSLFTGFESPSITFIAYQFKLTQDLFIVYPSNYQASGWAVSKVFIYFMKRYMTMMVLIVMFLSHFFVQKSLFLSDKNTFFQLFNQVFLSFLTLFDTGLDNFYVQNNCKSIIV